MTILQTILSPLWMVSSMLPCTAGRSEILQPDNDRYATRTWSFFALLVCAVKTSLTGFSFLFLSGPLVENVKDVYSLQQLKQLMADLDSNPQQFPTLGIVYAFLTSFDIDNDLKRIIASRWWVQFCCVFHFSAQIKPVFDFIGAERSTYEERPLKSFFFLYLFLFLFYQGLMFFN